MAGAALPRLVRSQGREALIDAIGASGAAIVDDALSPDSLAGLRAALAPWFDAAPACEGPFFGRHTRRFSALFAKAIETAPLAVDDLALPAAEALLHAGSDRCDCIQLNLTQAISIGPGEAAQLLHRDDTFFPFSHDGHVMLNVMWTLDPFTEANGATRLAPGSHRWPRERQALPTEVVAATAAAGAAIFWLGSTLHGGGANVSTEHRRGVVMSYSQAWLAPAEKLLLSIPPERARALPERLQRLIGYQTHRPNLGWIEGRDPLEWLRSGGLPLAAAQDNLTAAQAKLVESFALGANGA